jgi:hypothetical protein
LFIEHGHSRLDPALLEQGFLTSGDIAERDRALVAPTFAFMRGLVVGAWGRRPAKMTGGCPVLAMCVCARRVKWR